MAGGDASSSSSSSSMSFKTGRGSASTGFDGAGSRFSKGNGAGAVFSGGVHSNPANTVVGKQTVAAITGKQAEIKKLLYFKDMSFVPKHHKRITRKRSRFSAIENTIISIDERIYMTRI